MFFHRLLLLWTGGLIVAAFLACGESTLTEPEEIAEETPSAADLPLAPDFTLERWDGGALTLSQFRGQVVFLNFWATWCPVCRAEMPFFEQLYQKYRDRGLVLLGISIDENPRTAIPPFLEELETPITYPLLIGSVETAQAYGVQFLLPVTFLIDREGRIVHTMVGGQDHTTVEALVQGML